VSTDNSETNSETPETPLEETVIESPPEETATETPPEETAIEPPPAAVEKPQRKGGAFGFLALLFSLAALAGTGWMWWQDQAAGGEQDQRVITEISRLDSSDSELTLKLKQVRDQLESLAAGDVGAEFKALQDRLAADRAKMAGVEKAIGEQMSLGRSLQAATESMQGRLLATEAALTGMSTRELDAGGELDLAEVDYLLRLANERLKLFSDPVAADQALEVADMHLDALDNPIYLGVRQDIARARRALAAVDVPDYLKIAGQLNDIQQQIASLPFQGQDPVAVAAREAQEEGWWEKVKGVFSNLVTVRRSTEQENERVSLQDKDYIRQRVWLQLEIAHLSLMQRDQQAFRTSLQRIQESLATWFDQENAAYKGIEQEIKSLSAIEVQVDVPDITAPWSTLRMLRGGRSRPATPVNEAPVEQTPAEQTPPEQTAADAAVTEEQTEG